MKHWEFLIQKQGDRSWLPLESPDVEILEGRYRVVVRSSRPDTDVDVRVVHHSSEVPPKRKIQKRSRRTNSEGLIVVIPYTYLKPGIWELHCSGLMSDLGQNWQYAVHLQVLPQEALLGEGVDFDVLEVTEASTPSPVFTSTEAIDMAQMDGDDTSTVAPAIAVHAAEVIPHEPPATVEPSAPLPPLSTSPQKAEQILQSLLESIMPAAELSVENWDKGQGGEEYASGGTSSPVSSTLRPSAEPSAEVISADGDVPIFAIALTETTYVARRGQSLTISGQVEATSQIAGNAASQELVAAGELRICLCNPERGQVISEIRQPLISIKVLPSPFSCTIEIPADCQTQLILGQVILYGNRHEDYLAPAPNQGLVLATQPFTITSGLEELLGVISSDQGKADTQELQPTPAAPAWKQPETASTPLNLALLELVKTPKTHQPVRFQPAANQPLPPIIDPPKPVNLRPEPALPKFPQRQSAEVVEPVQIEEAESATPDVEANASPAEAMDAMTSVPMQSDEVIADESGLEAVEAPPGLLSAVDAAFQDLRLQYRFWTRLNALAADAEFLEPLKLESSTSDDSANAVPNGTQMEAAKVDAQYHPWLDADGLAQEIVVEDEAVKPESQSAVDDRPQRGQAVSRLPVSLPQTSDEVVVPIPQLEIQRGELIAGQTIRIRVQLLPLHGVQLAVKLWIQDCQTRSLLDGPRWIEDLLPDGLGNLEATFDLTVPPGSLEMRFEAIAVDSSTQQESHKVSIDRTVIPPDLPVLQPLEDALPWT